MQVGVSSIEEITRANGLTDKDKKKMQVQIKDVKKFIQMIESMGGKVPKTLKTSLNRLEVAINTGKDLAKAASEASKDLRTYTADLMAACKTVDQEMQMVCEAKVARQWQARSVQWTLDPKNEKSVISKFIQKTVSRYTPNIICKHWDYCAKAAK